MLFRPKKRVLDVGCGVGHMLAHVARPMGSDRFQQAHDCRSTKTLSQLDVQSMDIEDTNQLNDKFDFVISVNSITEMIDIRSV